MLNQLYSSIRFHILSSNIIIRNSIRVVLISLSLSCSLALICSAIGNERIESLIQEDQNVKRRRDRYQKQSSLLSTLTRQLSIHDNRAAAASSWSDTSGNGKCIQINLLYKICAMFCNREAALYINLQRAAQEPMEVLQGRIG